MYEVTMPKLSDSMEVGKIIEWRVAEGDAVSEGDILAEVESDKASMELECFQDGTIAKIVYEDGTEVSVGETIALIAGEDEDAGDVEEEAPEAEAETAPQQEEAESEEEPEEEAEESGAKKEAKAEAREDAKKSEGEAAEGGEKKEEGKDKDKSPERGAREEQKEAAEKKQETPTDKGDRIAASPYAKKLAQEKGVDLSKVEGSGPDGRIVARDIQAAAAGESTPTPKKEKAEKAEPEKAEKKRAEPEKKEEKPKKKGTQQPTSRDVEPRAKVLAEKMNVDLGQCEGTGLNGRITIDDVLAEVGNEPPEVEPSPDEELPPLEVGEDEADVEDAPFRLKTQARRTSAATHVIPHFFVTRGAEVSALLGLKSKLKDAGAGITHAVMAASLAAVKEHPKVNRTYDHGRLIKWKNVNLGLAVAAESGLTVAVLKGAQEMDLATLAEKTNDLVDRARNGKLKPEERTHATFTISNLGMFDVEHFQPIINPPSAITLAVASALETPIVKDGELAAGHVMRLTLACDHRVLDGVAAAKFLQTLKGLLESPKELLDL